MVSVPCTAVVLLRFSLTYTPRGNGKTLSQDHCSEKDTTLQEPVSLIGERRCFVQDTDNDNDHSGRTDHKAKVVLPHLGEEGEKKNVQ